MRDRVNSSRSGSEWLFLQCLLSLRTVNKVYVTAGLFRLLRPLYSVGYGVRYLDFTLCHIVVSSGLRWALILQAITPLRENRVWPRETSHVGVLVYVPVKLLCLRMISHHAVWKLLSLMSCGGCDDGRLMICCDRQREGCRVWYHHDCLGLSLNEGQQLGASETYVHTAQILIFLSLLIIPLLL